MAASAPASTVSPTSGPGRLVSQLEAAWASLFRIGDQLKQSAEALQQIPGKPDDLTESREQYRRESQFLLIEPIEQFTRARPLRQSLEAMREFDRQASAPSVAARKKIDHEFLTLLCLASWDLCEPWRIRQSSGTRKEWLEWEGKLARRNARANDLIGKYRNWSSSAANKPGPAEGDEDRHKRTEPWWRCETAVTELHTIELAFRDLKIDWLDHAIAVVASLQQERTEILVLVRKMVDWVRSGADPSTSSPVDSIVLAACDERLRVWSSLVQEQAAKRLPEKVDLIVPRHVGRFRTTRPRESFLEAYKSLCETPERKPIQTYWEDSARIVREASRSKEILDYWRAEASGLKDAEELFDQARNNAVTVLEDQLGAPSSIHDLESGLAQIFWIWSEEGSTLLEASEIGWVELLRKPRGRRLSKTLTREGRSRVGAFVHRSGRWGANLWERALETFGGKLPTRPAITPVVRRTTFRDTLSLPASRSQLPRIYGSLFRVAPLEDRRFLIGRDSELLGLEQALSDWDEGRFAACIFVGARGSGKTSLLNCATSGAFSGRTVLRTQFVQRSITPEAIDRFLCSLLGVPSSDDLAAAFDSERRILMIEEGERIYLRKVGGFEGARHLMQWIQRTAGTTLWILTMNDRAFQALSAGTQFSRVFSHRINAMSVSRDDLENAVLERHRLSGLRLEFAPPPASDPRISRMKLLLGLEDSPQRLFFDSLYQQSGGVFRSAFELWLSSIERVEGETLKIRQPLEPAFATLRGELQQDDFFTMLAIQEHGSLEYHEMAEIFSEEEDASIARMDRLVALGLVDKDPDHLGFRLRPEAHRFTNAALRRINLTEELQ